MSTTITKGTQVRIIRGQTKDLRRYSYTVREVYEGDVVHLDNGAPNIEDNGVNGATVMLIAGLDEIAVDEKPRLSKAAHLAQLLARAEKERDEAIARAEIAEARLAAVESAAYYLGKLYDDGPDCWESWFSSYNLEVCAALWPTPQE